MRPMLCLSCIIALGVAVPTQAAPLSAGDTTSAAKRTTGAPANERRAYPASCLAYPLPTEPTGPVYSRVVTLYPGEGEVAELEGTDVVLEVWRVPCTRADDAFKSATLMRLTSDDPGINELGLLFPVVRIGQGDVEVSGRDSVFGWNLIRVTNEPNTIVSDTRVHVPQTFGTTYVLDNIRFPNEGFPSNPTQFDFNDAFVIAIDPFVYDGMTPIQFSMDVPAYEPTEEDYPTAFQSLPITGYMSSNWYAPEASGEGIVVQVYEREVSEPGECEDLGGGTILPFSFTWFTYGTDGKPFWIYGDACVPAADPTRVTVDAFYTTGLGFAGDFDEENAQRQPWGQVSFEFPSCNEMSVDYECSIAMADGVPRGTGHLDYKRLGNVNGLVCD